MPTLTNAREGLEIIQTALQAALDADATFTPYGGANVVLMDDEATAAESAGKPYIYLNVESDVPSVQVSTADARDATVAFDVVANDFSGATTGAANPVGSDTLLSTALMNFMRDNYAALRDAGLCFNRIEQGRERIQTSDEAPAEHRNPHRIFFTYFTP